MSWSADGPVRAFRLLMPPSRQRPEPVAANSRTGPFALRKRPFAKSALLFALLHFAVLLAVASLIFFASHIPPKAVNLDRIILFLAGVEWALEAPRKFFLWLWPGETTPRGLGFALTVLNSLAWGVALAALKRLWRQLTV